MRQQVLSCTIALCTGVCTALATITNARTAPACPKRIYKFCFGKAKRVLIDLAYTRPLQFQSR